MIDMTTFWATAINRGHCDHVGPDRASIPLSGPTISLMLGDYLFMPLIVLSSSLPMGIPTPICRPQRQQFIFVASSTLSSTNVSRLDMPLRARFASKILGQPLFFGLLSGDDVHVSLRIQIGPPEGGPVDHEVLPMPAVGM